METIVYPAKSLQDNTDAIQEAGEALRRGETVIFPTETVYGLGANALDSQAAQKIYAAKGRPSDNPLIVHISSMTMLEDVARDIPREAQILAEVFWPGPLTMIFRKKKIVPDETTGGLDTVAVRMPSDPVALGVIQAAGVPIAAPSANLSGRPSITTGRHAVEEMRGRVNRILLGEDSLIGLESTVLDMTVHPPVILRPGKIGLGELTPYIPAISKEKETLDQGEIPKSPGMKYTHYSPKAKVYVLGDSEETMVDRIQSMVLEAERQGQKAMVLCKNSHRSWYKGEVLSLGETGEEMARLLFRALREADERQADLLLSEDFYDEKDEMTKAVMNRLRKAATEEKSW